jgi:type II secretory pathway component GspD/PulD (secretin)
MKLKLIMLALVGTLATQQSAMTQINTDTTDTNAQAPAPAASTSAWPTNPITPTNGSDAQAAASNSIMAANSQGTPVPDTNVPAAAIAPAASVAMTDTTDTNMPAAVTGTNTPVPVASATAPVTVPIMDTNVPAAVPAATAPTGVAGSEATPASAAAPAETNATPVAANIPLIQFQDVPLTVAIENLARQAGINYLLDPKIGFGQPDANGQIKAEPTLSIRWENVTAEQALIALLNNYDLQLVQDPKTKIGRITVKDPAAPPPLETRVVQLKYASTSNMIQSVQAALTDRRSHVIADPRTDQLVVVGTENEQDSITTLVTDLDKPTRQVLIETKLVQISSTPATAKGVNWAGTLAAQNVSFGNGRLDSGQSTLSIPGTPYTVPTGPTTTATITPGHSTATTITTTPSPSILPGGLSWNTLTGLNPAIGFLNADGVQAVISFLNSSYDAQVVSTPRVVTLDNEQASISVTREFPVINVTASTAGVSSGSSSISYSNIGTVLQVTPRITANDYIWLRVVPDVSSFFATVSKVIAGSVYQADEFDSRHIETQVMIPNANTLVMGGMIQDNPTASWTSVPVLGNIPYLGWAFKSENVTMDKGNLIIFITPTIVKDDDFQPTTTDFLASKPAQMKEPMNPNGTWDSSGYDWSNPAPVPGEFNGSDKH